MSGITVVGLHHWKAASPLLPLGVIVIPATLRITFAFWPSIKKLFTTPTWLQRVFNWYKPVKATPPEVRTDRVFKNKGLYLSPKKMQRFIASDLLLILDRLCTGLSVDKWLDTNADGSTADVQRNNEAISRSLDAFRVAPSPIASSDHAFTFLEKAGSSTTPMMDILARELSDANAAIEGESPAKDIHELIKKLSIQDQSRAAYRSHQRASAFRAFSAQEVEQAVAFCNQPHTLAEVIEQMQTLVAGRIEAYQKAVNDAASEASDLWDTLAASQSRKPEWRSLGIDLVRLTTQKARTTLLYLQKWIDARLDADLLDTASPQYQNQLNLMISLRSEWARNLQSDNAELVGEINKTFESFTSPLAKITKAQAQHTKERDVVDAELSKHRDDVLTLPKNSLNSLDVLTAVAEQNLSKDFVCDPKHFVNSLHKFLGKGEIAFESFQQASTVRNMISQQAAVEVNKAESLSYLDVVEARVQCRREITQMARDDLFKKLKSEHPYDDSVVIHSQRIADFASERALKVLEYQQASSDCRADELRGLLADLHRDTTELIAKRDSAIQAWHKRCQTLEHGLAWS